ncbi:hypothetical protein [Pseudonocardia sp. GCM10023141]|uniref:hypothetical protein n=1 Tax=Pseudonocardia sp. GCM10023141 TaxID=3252653 RepID=UPI00360FDAD8
MPKTSAFHPDLKIGRFIPKFTMGPRLTRLLGNIKIRTPPPPPDILIEDVVSAGASLRLYRPRSLEGAAPALFWTEQARALRSALGGPGR